MPYIVIKPNTLKKNDLIADSKSILVVITLLFSGVLFAQNQPITSYEQNEFWKNVQFGGGIGLNFGSGYTEISVAPSAIYNVNETVAIGTALQFGFISSKNHYTSFIYGGSVIGLINPIPQIQFSVELEELRVNTDYQLIGANLSDNYWNTGLFLGAGYRTGNVTIGARYDVLHDPNKSVYNEAFMPFIRVYF